MRLKFKNICVLEKFKLQFTFDLFVFIVLQRACLNVCFSTKASQPRNACLFKDFLYFKDLRKGNISRMSRRRGPNCSPVRTLAGRKTSRIVSTNTKKGANDRRFLSFNSKIFLFRCKIKTYIIWLHQLESEGLLSRISNFDWLNVHALFDLKLMQ